jgi:hypothetical protein
MPKGVFVVYTDVEEDRIEAFNTWYNEIHVPDLLRLKCITGAERFMLRGSGQELRLKSGELARPKFLTIYHTNTVVESEIRAELTAARPAWVEDGRMFPDFRSGQSTVYEEILPLQTKASATGA